MKFAENKNEFNNFTYERSHECKSKSNDLSCSSKHYMGVL